MEQFIQAVCITVMMQIDTFVDERMKILDALLENIKNAFGNPVRVQAQLNLIGPR